MPERLQPGPLAGRISFFAPVSLFFFFFLMFIITTMRGIELHPMNYFFRSDAGALAARSARRSHQLLRARLALLLLLPHVHHHHDARHRAAPDELLLPRHGLLLLPPAAGLPR